MQSQALKVLLSIFFGAFVGGVVALELTKPLWWIGVLTGGSIGYFSYEWKQVLTTIPKAWKAARLWEMPHVDFHLLGWMGFFFINLFAWFIGLFWMMASNELEMDHFYASAFVATMFTWIPFLFCLDLQDRGRLQLAKHTTKSFAVLTFPAFVVFYYIPRGVILLVPEMWKVLVDLVTWAGRFSRELIRLIHSDARIICGTYAMIGAAIGYFHGHAAVGALLAAFIGVLHDLFIHHYRPEWRRIQ